MFYISHCNLLFGSITHIFSDLLLSKKDKGRCDPATGRRLYDNGKRKDGTPIGNPGIGEMCSPDPIQPLDVDLTQNILDAAVKSALLSSGSKSDAALNKEIQQTKDLVRPSFERSMQNANDDEKNRGIFNFELYSTLRAIVTYLDKDKTALKAFSSAWGNELVSMFASNANRKDYVSPFTEKEDEFQDYDYPKNSLLDALGKLTVTLDKFKAGGIIGFYEISIPYDDYGSVVTVAMDDYTTIGGETLLQEQNYDTDGPMQAIIRVLIRDAGIKADTLNTFWMDTNYKDSVNYNPTQLLLSLNGLTKM